ncbi:acyltransferase [Leucobacter zeae]|nr:acyltransferase [Leucobacter zeae]
MSKLIELQAYSDEKGNTIEYRGAPLTKGISIVFRGSNNRLIVESPARIDRLTVLFDCNNGTVRIGANDRQKGSHLRLNARVGEDSEINIGRYVTMTNSCFMTVAEGQSITVGDDCMIASGNALRTHDGHPIFDLETGKRTNVSRSIAIGNHVWLGAEAVVMGGANIGDGSVIGFRSVVTKKVPNNSIAAGIPARVVKRNIAWERPNLTLTEPYYKPDSSTVETTPYWRPTVEDEPSAPVQRIGYWRRIGLALIGR